MAASPGLALEQADAERLIEVFETQCLQPLLRGENPSADGFRTPRGEAEFAYSGSVTRDDKVMLQIYDSRGLWGCDTTNNVYAIPAEGPGFARMSAALETYSDRLAAGAFEETTHCLQPLDGGWARSFVSTQPARPNTYVKLLVSATETFANGGPSLQEHYGAPDWACEGAQ